MTYELILHYIMLVDISIKACILMENIHWTLWHLIRPQGTISGLGKLITTTESTKYLANRESLFFSYYKTLLFRKRWYCIDGVSTNIRNLMQIGKADYSVISTQDSQKAPIL